ncbi:uncharacterized protein LOC125492630 [Beta vulgaris subsp. vulgaris]|nr:uncharacterized protein LOC125492630 [Beta vulgaris subsp. vulgaris]
MDPRVAKHVNDINESMYEFFEAWSAIDEEISKSLKALEKLDDEDEVETMGYVGVVGVLIYMGRVQSKINQQSKKQYIILIDKSYTAMKLCVVDNFFDHLQQLSSDLLQDAVVVLARGLVLKNDDGIYLQSVENTQIMINPRTKIASKLKQWFRNDQFVRHKTLWINKTSLPLNRLLCISNSMRLSISEFHKYNGGCKCRVVGRIDDINKVNSSNSVFMHIKIKDISGSLSVGLSHKQICFILQLSTLDLPKELKSCKAINKLSHDGKIYKKVSFEHLYMRSMRNDENKAKFFDLCLEYKNQKHFCVMAW